MATKQSLPRPSRMETKAETTTAVVKALVDKETAARDAKTKRLRAARIERAVDEQKAEPSEEARKTPVSKRTKP